MAHRRHAHALPLPRQLHDHATPGIGLSRPRRALDRQAAAVQLRRQSPGRLRRRLVVLTQQASRLGPAPRRVAEQQVAPGPRHAVRTATIYPVLGRPLPDPQQAVRHHVRGHGVVGVHAARVAGLPLRGQADVDRPRLDGDRRARRHAVLVEQRVPDLDFGVLLRERVAVLGCPLLALFRDLLHRHQAAQGRLLVQVVLVAQVAQPVLLPQAGLELPPVPVEHVRQTPARLVGRARRRALVQPVQQQRPHRLDPLVPFLLLLRQLLWLGRRSRYRLAGRHHLVAPRLQPLPQPPRRHAVVLVVAAHDLAHIVRRLGAPPRLQQRLQTALGPAHVGQVDFAVVPEEPLQPLDRVALHAGPHRLPRHREQVDEHLVAQQVVHLDLACRVAAHQPLERRRLVGGVVVDVHLRIQVAPRHHLVDESLESRPFRRRVVGPGVVVGQRVGGGARAAGPSEQVLQAAGAAARQPVTGEGVALQVEEHVPCARCRQAAQPLAVDDGQHLVVGRLARPVAQLHGRLVLRLLQPLAAAPPGPARGQGLFTQPRQGVRVEGVTRQLRALAARDVGHKAQVVVVVALVVAHPPPVAQVALLAGLRVGRLPVRHRRRQPRLHALVVGAVVVDAVGLGRVVAARRHHHHPLGPASLHSGQQVGVQAQLQQRPRLGLLRQLGVGDLVVVVAESTVARVAGAVSVGAGRVDPQQEVGPAAPAVVVQGRLRDHLGPVPHRRQRGRHAGAVLG